MGVVLLLLIGACCVVTGALVLAIDPIATSLMRDRLAAEGIACDERFALDLPWMMDVATVAPTRCTLVEGEVESIELLDPVMLELGPGFEPRAVRAGRVRIALRGEAPVAPPGNWGAALEALSVPERVGSLAGGAVRLAARDVPTTTATTVEVLRGTEVTTSLTDVAIDGHVAGAPLTMRAARVDLPPFHAPLGARASASITGLEITATGGRAELTGQIDLDARLPILGSFRQNARLSLIAEGLDGPSPTYQLTF